MTIVYWLLVALACAGPIYTIAMIDKPRKPYTPADAIGSLIVAVLYVAAITYLWRTP